MSKYGTTGAKNNKELFKHAAKWLTENKSKGLNIGDYKKLFGVNQRLQQKQGRNKPIVIGLRNTAADLLRDSRLKKANELLVAAGLGDDLKAGRKLSNLIQKPFNADHKWEVQEFGPVLEDLYEEFASGNINETEFKKRLNIFIANNPADSVKNIEKITGRQNQLKRETVEAKNKSLQKLEATNPSARYTSEYNKKVAAFTSSLNKTNQLNGIHAFAKQQLMAQTQNYDATYIPKNNNGNGTNGNGTNGKNGNGLTVNGKNGKNGLLKSLENVKDYSGITKFGRNADQLANIGVNVSTGNYGGAAIGAATYGTSKALQDPKVQARVAKQITQLVAERGAKSAAKFLPGLDVVLSGKESWDYLKRGRWDQAGIAALSGAIGWIPLIGDGASAALDLSNTGIDIARLQAPTGANKKKSQNRLTRFLKGLNT